MKVAVKHRIIPYCLFALLCSSMLTLLMLSFARAQQSAQQSTPQAPQARQPGAVYDFDNKDERPRPAPIHDLSGIWEPAAGPSDGIQPFGAKAMPSDGKPEHELPYTPQGLEAFRRAKPGIGLREVPAALVNDPLDFCDPAGFPREDLFELRTTEILQTPQQVVILYEFDKVWRVIWTDGRELPKDPEPRWFGYSVGKWEDDYTFVVQSNGMDERTWIDNGGRPHSDELRIEERFHRRDYDHLEITVIIDDPKFYTKPWVALDKLPMRLQSPNFDIREMICAPSETADYNKGLADPAAVTPDSTSPQSK
jgi:hypothetical protein